MTLAAGLPGSGQATLTLAVLAGGRSTRMGRDKALLPFLGRPLIQRVLDRLAGLADEELVAANTAEAYAFLGRPLVPDLEPGCGPLGGLASSLAAARSSLLAAVGCDMPFADRELLAFERDLLVQEAVDVVIPQGAQGLEPLHAVYRKESCLPVVRAALQAGERRMIAWLPQVRVRTLTLEEIARFSPDGLAFWNLNTPEEFVRAEGIARQGN